MNYTSPRRELLYPSATAHPPIGKAALRGRTLHNTTATYAANVWTISIGWAHWYIRLAFLQVHIRTKQNCIKTVWTKRTCSYYYAILAWFYIEMLIFIKYVNLYFSLLSGISKLFRFPLGKPPPELTMPLPWNLAGDENNALQIIGFSDGRWHWYQPIRVITSHALQFKWWRMKSPCLQWRRYRSKYS